MDDDIEVVGTVEGPRESPSNLTDIDNLINASPKKLPAAVKKKRSPIYKHYTWDDKKQKYVCNYCKSGEYIIPKGGGTGSLINHMNDKHKDKLPENPKITNHFLKQPTAAPAAATNRFTNEDFVQLLVKFIVATDQPFSIVEEESFVQLLRYLKDDNSLEIPLRKKTKNLIMQCHHVKQAELKHILINSKSKINLIIDCYCWTSANGFSFQGVVATWIDKSWKLQVAVLVWTLLIAASFLNVNLN